MQGRLVAPIHVKFGRTDGHLGPLGCAIFHPNRHRWWECGPKISKISIFGSCPIGVTPLTDFEILGLLYLGASYSYIAYQCFKFDVIRFTGYGAIAEKPRVCQLGRIFMCTL